MKRRSFGKIIVMAGTSLIVKNTWPNSFKKLASDIVLPEPLLNKHSVEICLNSRLSVHSGYKGTLNQQVIANVLWAASRPPPISSSRTIYVALSDAVYLYDPLQHKLTLHINGNRLSESNAAFEVGIATDPENSIEDAGLALHWAHLASVSFWETITDQTGCCPKDSAYDHANKNWDPLSQIHLVNCYGKINSTKLLSATLVAKSSDDSLPEPIVNGPVILEDAMREPLFGSNFKEDSLEVEEISQLAWAAYGCTPHSISNKAGLTVASWNAQYYITRRIYILKPGSVMLYHMRQQSGEISSKDHRVEQINAEDRRSQLRSAVERISQSAPVYFIFCAEKPDRPQRLEAGYCGASALIQATAMQLQGHYCADFTDTERLAIQNAAGIPPKEKPLLIFAAGRPFETSVNQLRAKAILNLTVKPNPFTDHVEISFLSDNISQVKADIYDVTGKLVRALKKSVSGSQRNVLLWDGRNHYGKMVAKGTYICKISNANTTKSVLLHKN